MGNKIIQVPMDERFVANLDDLSRRRSESRSALIREACRLYMKALQDEEFDRQYEESYRRFPEPASENAALLQLAAEGFDADENW
jgi:metal-responsive CopG/Arc/MetJ family transcriptional regulator